MKFSILIPAYKRQYLKECIESILKQTYTDFEIIIVNDASPEDLDSIINSFSDKRIRYFINDRNCGAIHVVDNWNICLKYAQGEYVICMGDDDRLLPNCLEEYTHLIQRYPKLGIYHAWTEIIDEHSNVVEMQEARPEREGVYSMMWCRWLSRIQYIGDFLFDRQLLLQNDGFYKLPLAWASDDISTYIAALHTGIANMQVPGFQYRVNSQTISKTSNAAIKLEAIRQEEEWYKHFLATEPTTINQIERTYYRMLVKRLPSFIAKKRAHTISLDIANHGLLRVWTFWKKRKQYHLNISLIVYAIIQAVKYKRKRK